MSRRWRWLSTSATFANSDGCPSRGEHFSGQVWVFGPAMHLAASGGKRPERGPTSRGMTWLTAPADHSRRRSIRPTRPMRTRSELRGTGRNFGRELRPHCAKLAGPFCRSRQKPCKSAKPSDGLEPSTPSLPWNHAGPKKLRLAGRSPRDLLAEIRPNCGRLAGPCSPGVPRLLSLCGSDFSFWRKRLDQAMAASGGGAYIVLHDA
jgi:hypothetical protein